MTVDRFLSAETLHQDDFGDPFSHEVGEVVWDAKTQTGPWATMTEKSFNRQNGAAQGWGQKYVRQANGELHKVESVHVFRFYDWFRVRDGWDCDFRYLVVTPDNIRLMPAGNDLLERRMREKYPDSVTHEKSLSRHRGRLEGGEELDPELYERIRTEGEFL